MLSPPSQSEAREVAHADAESGSERDDRQKQGAVDLAGRGQPKRDARANAKQQSCTVTFRWHEEADLQEGESAEEGEERVHGPEVRQLRGKHSEGIEQCPGEARLAPEQRPTECEDDGDGGSVEQGGKAAAPDHRRVIGVPRAGGIVAHDRAHTLREKEGEGAVDEGVRFGVVIRVERAAGGVEVTAHAGWPVDAVADERKEALVRMHLQRVFGAGGLIPVEAVEAQRTAQDEDEGERHGPVDDDRSQTNARCRSPESDGSPLPWRVGQAPSPVLVSGSRGLRPSPVRYRIIRPSAGLRLPRPVRVPFRPGSWTGR